MRQQKNSIIMNISYHQCYNNLWKSSFASCSFRFHKNQTFPAVSSLNFFDRPVRCPISVQSSKRLGESAKIGNAECWLGFSIDKSFFQEWWFPTISAFFLEQLHKLPNIFSEFFMYMKSILIKTGYTGYLDEKLKYGLFCMFLIFQTQLSPLGLYWSSFTFMLECS